MSCQVKLNVLTPIFHFKVSEGRIYDHYLHILWQFSASYAKKCLLAGWTDGRMERGTEGRMEGFDGLQRQQQGTHYPLCHCHLVQPGKGMSWPSQQSDEGRAPPTTPFTDLAADNYHKTGNKTVFG